MSGASNNTNEPPLSSQEVPADNTSTNTGTNTTNKQSCDIFSRNRPGYAFGYFQGKMDQSANNMRSSYQNSKNLFSRGAQNYNGAGSSYGTASSYGAALRSSSPPAYGSYGSSNIFGDNYTNLQRNNSTNIFGYNSNDLHGFKMFPSEAELSKLKEQSLTNINNLKIWNNYGQIHFLEPVSIQDINFQEILIMPNKIEVLSENLLNKKRQYLYLNYLNFMILPQRKKIVIRRAIQVEVKQKGMKLISLGEVNGDLLVQL